MKRLAVVLALGLGALGPSARAVDTTDNLHFDFGVKMAMVGGTVSTTEYDNDLGRDFTTRFTFGGVAVSVGANFDLARYLSVNGSVHILFDPNISQVTRKGLDVTVALYVLGGARRTMLVTDDMIVMERDPFGLAFLLRTSLSGYTLSPNSSRKTDAALLSIDPGIEYRMELGDRSGLTLALLYSGLSIPAGTRIKAALITVEAGYRIFL